MISIGTKAPDWKATVYNNGKKEVLSSEDLAGSWYVLYWWPFDFTGACNSEILGFQELEKEFAELGVKLIGASCDSFYSHEKWFSEATGSSIRATVIVDPDGVVKSFGANFFNVTREPQDVLTTARGFIRGGCSLSERRSL